jgi:hypothetical protein
MSAVITLNSVKKQKMLDQNICITIVLMAIISITYANDKINDYVDCRDKNSDCHNYTQKYNDPSHHEDSIGNEFYF